MISITILFFTLFSLLLAQAPSLPAAPIPNQIPFHLKSSHSGEHKGPARMTKRYNFGPVIQDGQTPSSRIGENGNPQHFTPTSKLVAPTFPPLSQTHTPTPSVVPVHTSAATTIRNTIIPIDSSTILPPPTSIVAPIVPLVSEIQVDQLEKMGGLMSSLPGMENLVGKIKRTLGLFRSDQRRERRQEEVFESWRSW